MASLEILETAVSTLVANDAALKDSVTAAVTKIAALAGQIAAQSNDAAIADLASQITAVAGDLAADKGAIDAAVAPAQVVEPAPGEPAADPAA